MRVLGIETSCDETGLALWDSQHGLLDQVIYSQIPIHAEYGGVVPELASRDHIRKSLPLLQELLTRSNTPRQALDGIAYTAGPGLVGALLVGASLARSLAWGLGIPALGVHHLEGHLLAPLLEPEPPDFPFLALLVSGGHTQLVAVEALGAYRLLGESLDDAAGEAFDKTAKVLGLPYPGGPQLAALAERGNPERLRFPRPMTDRPGLDFSFSGLKTHVLTTLKAGPQDGGPGGAVFHADVARAFEEAVVDTLMIKCRRALETTGLRTLVLAGGVAANQRLRARMAELMARMKGRVHYPRLALCTDNGAMIAYAGGQRLLAGERQGLDFRVRARWPLIELRPPGADERATGAISGP